jgi:hypothetical protein
MSKATSSRDFAEHRKDGAFGKLSDEDDYGNGDGNGELFGTDFRMVKHDNGTFSAYHPRELTVVEDTMVTFNSGDRVRVANLSATPDDLARLRRVSALEDEREEVRNTAVGKTGVVVRNVNATHDSHAATAVFVNLDGAENNTFTPFYPKELVAVDTQDTPTLPQIGDRVRVVKLSSSCSGVNYFLKQVGALVQDNEALRAVGKEGTIVSTVAVGDYKRQLEGAVFVNVDGDQGEVYVPFLLSELEVIPETSAKTEVATVPKSGDRVRVVTLNATPRQIKALERVYALDIYRAPFRVVGRVGTVAHDVFIGNEESLKGAVFVRFSDTDYVPFLPGEIQVITETTETTEAEAGSEVAPAEPTLEALVLKLLSIFPNQSPSDVLDPDDEYTEESDFYTVDDIVPKLRAMLIDHPIEKARRKERKKVLRREMREAERESLMARLEQLNKLLGF